MTVFDLKPGERGKIVGINISGGAKSRLSSLGINVGETVEILSFSLFKSSVLISCAAVRVGIRKAFAKNIGVEKCSE